MKTANVVLIFLEHLGTFS